MLACFFWIVPLLYSLPLVALTLKQPVHAECAVLMNANNGRILWQKNQDLQVFPASTTKIATVFYVLMQKPDLNKRLVAQKEALVCVSPFQKRQNNYSKCPSYWHESDGSHVGIKVGEVMTMEDLLYATMLSSGNDASNVLAQHLGNGSIERFMDDLNLFLQKLGCTKTHFTNPHGLHHPNHVTTAKDMARLAQCAMYHPLFRKIAKTQNYERAATNKQPKTIYTQSNRLLRQGRYYYPYACGIKTGFHSHAKHTLVAAAEKDGRLLICSLMACNDRSQKWQDATTLFEAAFSEQKVEKLLMKAGDQPYSRPIVDGVCELACYTKEPLKISYYPSEEPEARLLLVWDDEVELPVKKGKKVGAVKLLADNVEIAQLPLYAKGDVARSWYAASVAGLKAYWWLCLVGLVALYPLFRGFRSR